MECSRNCRPVHSAQDRNRSKTRCSCDRSYHHRQHRLSIEILVRVKFELLAGLDDVLAETMVPIDGCGSWNIRIRVKTSPIRLVRRTTYFLSCSDPRCFSSIEFASRLSEQYISRPATKYEKAGPLGQLFSYSLSRAEFTSEGRSAHLVRLLKINPHST